jgi:putative secretion ATPase (PEP-CTERM system associated)
MFDDFYGLTGRPFQLSPDPAFYFQSITHRKALSYLGYGLAQSEGFMVITGEVGSGKSTLVAHLVATIDPEQLTIGQVVTSKLDGAEIIHVVAQSFGLEIAGHDKAGALGAIESFLHEEARAGRRCLLVVDESQNLSVEALEELRMLSNLQLGSHPLLQTLLLGQPEFRGTLFNHPNLEQLRQRVIAAHHLEAMEAQEVEPYMLHRLKQVGWQGNPAFDAEVFAGIHQASGGIPRRINLIANRLMLLGAIEHKEQIDVAMLREVLAEMAADAGPQEEVLAPSPAREPEPLQQFMRPETAQPDQPQQFAPPATEPAAQQPAPPHPSPGLDPELVESLLAERDCRIAELEQAVVELSNAQHEDKLATINPELAALQERVAQLEAQLIEQERTMRQTLTMLIEWIEGEDGSQIAA